MSSRAAMRRANKGRPRSLQPVGTSDLTSTFMSAAQKSRHFLTSSMVAGRYRIIGFLPKRADAGMTLYRVLSHICVK